MRFLIITHVLHKQNGDKYYGYEPYVKEMNLWLKYVDEVEVVAPLSSEKISSIDLSYTHNKLIFTKIPSIAFNTFISAVVSIFKIPLIVFKILKACKKADHIHLRCPGNIGLLGCFVQILFPRKLKTAKYAGNWDPNAIQPWSYKLQRSILKSEFLTKNMMALVYGDWKDKSKNIRPFFTASYATSEKELIEDKPLKEEIRLIFVGALTLGKQPLISVKVAEQLANKGVNVKLSIYGDGPERNNIEDYIAKNKLEKFIKLHGNVSSDVIKLAYQKSHFLVFMSKSEGWPKVVAEAMFWKCLTISTKVSCIPDMLGYGERGSIVEVNVELITREIEAYILDENDYKKRIENAYNWSRNYTLDRFEQEIKSFLN